MASTLSATLHTPTFVSARSTFLFTASKCRLRICAVSLAELPIVCAVASKFYRKRPELYGLCIPHARFLASKAIDQGYKSVEIVQAYMLLAYYNSPTERFENDRTYTYSGIAIRMAVELNLWRSPNLPDGLDEASIAAFHIETRNREKTWLQVFNLDVRRSISLITVNQATNSSYQLPSDRKLCRLADRICLLQAHLNGASGNGHIE